MPALFRLVVYILGAGIATLVVSGVGYDVFVPLSTYYSLPEINESTSLRVHTHLREDAIQLFGFLTVAEKEFVAAGATQIYTGWSLDLRGPRRVVVKLAHHDDHLHVRVR